MRIHCLQHVPFETPAYIAEWADVRGHQLSVTKLYQNEGPPRPSEYEMLVVLGGPMGVNDEQEFSWLPAEKRAIEAAIGSGRAVLGICLGAQLIASVLGARVYKNPQKEIGWFPVELTQDGRGSRVVGALPPAFTAFHWHGDTFDIPSGAVWTTRSAACRHQAFEYCDGLVTALQFHLEITTSGIDALCAECAHELLHKSPFISSLQDIRGGNHFIAPAQAHMTAILDALAKSDRL